MTTPIGARVSSPTCRLRDDLRGRTPYRGAGSWTCRSA